MAIVAGVTTNFDGTTPGFPAVRFGDDDETGVDGTFIGFTASPSSAINTVQFVKTTFLGAGDNWAFDNVLVVPEPSRVLLIGLGLVVALSSRRRSAPTR